MKNEPLLVWIFATLLVAMAFTQLLDFSFFNHIIYNYINPVGTGYKPFVMFTLPVTFAIIAMEMSGVFGLLLVDRNNSFRGILINLGVVAMAVWVLFLASILIRGAPIVAAGFFGSKLQQPANFLALIQAVGFLLLGIFAKQADNKAG